MSFANLTVEDDLSWRMFDVRKLTRKSKKILCLGGQGGETAQTMYAHMNKWIKKLVSLAIIFCISWRASLLPPITEHHLKSVSIFLHLRRRVGGPTWGTVHCFSLFS
jgi:hypothetical protein